MKYGTLTEPLVVESELNADVKQLKSQVNNGKWIMIFGLIVACVFCVATFAMVCVATEYSKELVIVDTALTDKKTQQVVSTREHEQVITDPITGAAGVKALTFYTSDGGVTRAEVMAFEKVPCNAATKAVNCVDGSHYFFKTVLGVYAATPVINDDFESSFSFAPVDTSFYESAKSTKVKKLDEASFASGYHKMANMFAN